jgi:hypothetical protein
MKSDSEKKPSKTVVTAMHNEYRAQILILLNERVASRPEISEELDIPLDKVRYELDVLKRTQPPLIKLEYERPVRGAVEKFYRATKMAYLSPAEWPAVPESVKAGMRGSLLNLLVDDAVAAVDKGTFDSLDSAHMSWTPMLLDAKGWEEITAILYRAMMEAIKVKEESAERLIEKDAEGTSCTVSILGYASANEDRKAGPPTDARRLTDDSTRQNDRPEGKARRGSARDGKRKAAGKRSRKK